MHAGSEPARATFWLLDAADSLRGQSRANPDGTGLGWFDEAGRAQVEKQAIDALDDADFAAEARERTSRTFVAHVRKSSGTPVALCNTHPFTLDGRIFAHNGGVGRLDLLEAELGADMARVQGHTDSERIFALVSREIARAGNVAAGIAAAYRWIARTLPVSSVHMVLADATDLWALRFPAFHEL